VQAVQGLRVGFPHFDVGMVDKIVFCQPDHVLAVLGLQAHMFGLRHPLKPSGHRPQQMPQRRPGKAEQPERFGPDEPLHEAEFAIVAQAFEAQYEIAVADVDRCGIGDIVHGVVAHPCRQQNRETVL
jgi:hypothetical protein